MDTVILCRCCGERAETAEQPHWDGSGTFTLLTCWNTACSMRGYTFAAKDYLDLDLVPYLKDKADDTDHRV